MSFLLKQTLSRLGIEMRKANRKSQMLSPQTKVIGLSVSGPLYLVSDQSFPCAESSGKLNKDFKKTNES